MIRASVAGLLLALGVLLCGFAAAGNPRPGVVELEHAEAVRSGWDAQAPPSVGWVPVELMDVWTERWPDHDGVVWYRLRWNQDDAGAPVAMLVDYICMGGAVYLNGSLLASDASLVEPLSRGWVKPQYFLLDAPLLRAGENELLVRVSGLAAYQPGFGTVFVGEPALVRERYESGMFQRHDARQAPQRRLGRVGGSGLVD